MVAPGCSRPLGFSPSGGLSARCMDPSRLVCPTRGHGVGGHDHVGLDRDLHVGVPALDRHLADAADDDVVDHHRRIRLQRGDIRDLDVIDLGVRDRARPRRAVAANSGPGRSIRSPPARRRQPTASSYRTRGVRRHDGGLSAGSSSPAGDRVRRRRRGAGAADDAGRRRPRDPGDARRAAVAAAALRRVHRRRPVYADIAGGVSGGPGLGPSPPGASRGSV